MRELERRSTPTDAPVRRVAVVGAGRLGTLLAAGLRTAGLDVRGPLGRDGTPPGDVEAVLLCVPDRAIPGAAAAIGTGPLVGHVSGASDLLALGGRPGFSLHPLMTVAGGEDPAVLHGVGAALAGTDPHALSVARALAAALGLEPIEIAEADRVAYHAAASVAANFLLPVEALAEELGASAGLDRAALVPLVRAAVENWARRGPAAALTGPVARGDATIVARQRAEVARRTPASLALFDALLDATRALAHAPGAVPC